MQRASAPIKISLPFANSAGAGFRRQIPNASQITIAPGAASFTDGFPPVTFTPVAAGGVPPYGSDMNGVLFQMSSWDRWHQAGAPIRYDNVFQAAIGGYPQEARVGSNAVPYLVWQSTIDNNTTNPDSAATRVGWQTPVFPNPSSLLAGLTINGSSASGDWGAGLAFDGGGATAPKKWIRVFSGNMEWVNNAYNAVLMTLSDGGNLSIIGNTSTGSITANSASIVGALTAGSATIVGALSAGSGSISGALSVGGSLTANTATITNRLTAKELVATGLGSFGTTVYVGTDLTVQGAASVTGTLTAGSVSAASAAITGAITANSITTSTLVANNTTPGVWAINGNQIYGAYLQAGGTLVFNNVNSGEWQAYTNGGHHVIRHRGSTGGDWQEFWDTNSGDWHWQVGGYDLMRLSNPGHLRVRGELTVGANDGSGSTQSFLRFSNAAGNQEGFILRNNQPVVGGNTLYLTPTNSNSQGLVIAADGSCTAAGGRVRASLGIYSPGSDNNTCAIGADFYATGLTGPAAPGAPGLATSILFKMPGFWMQASYCNLYHNTIGRAATDMGFGFAYPNACLGAVIQFIGDLPPHADSHPGLAVQVMDRTWFRVWVGRANYDMGGYLGAVVMSWGN